MISRITSWVLAHKRLVIGFWIVLTLVGGATSGAATKAMKQKFSVPGKEGWEANKQIEASFGGTGGNASPLVPVVTLKGDAASARPELASLERKVQATLPGARVAGYGSTGDKAFVSKDGHTAFIVAYPRPDPDQPFGDNPKAEKKLRAAIAGTTVGGGSVHLTGYDALQNQQGGNDGPGVLVEALVGGLGALLVLIFVFGSPLAIIPLFMAIPAILTSFLLVYGLTTITDVSPIVQFLVALIGLGVAIDYALLIVVRWREERTHGRDNDEAVAKAMDTAGRAVVLSGTTVAVGLLALVALPLPFLRSVGIGGMLIPLVSVGVALTLLPAVLSSFGPRLDKHRMRSDDKASRSWTAWARLIVRTRWAAAIAATIALGALLLAASGLQLGIANAGALAKSGDSRQGLDALTNSGIGSGVMAPHEILTPAAHARAVVQQTRALDGIHGAVAPSAANWSSNGNSDVLVLPSPDAGSGKARDLIAEVRDAAHSASPEALVGGLSAQNSDFIDAVYGNFPLMIALIAVITFILLARAFRSLLLPLKAVILNIVSVAAAWGVLQLVWQQGHGSQAIWGIEPTGAITAWIPLMVFAFLFGLSMDYEVFILSRMREEYDNTGSTTEAVVRGIGRTGRLVTSAALILFLAFLSMASGPQTDVKVMATGLAAGILLDATLIRAFLVPALVSLFGRWNWWLPKGPARLLRVQPSEGPG
jgi:putative drug exporter of the RND superfamily